MDKEAIREFVLELIEELHETTDAIIWECSGNIREDEIKNHKQRQSYIDKLEELLK